MTIILLLMLIQSIINNNRNIYLLYERDRTKHALAILSLGKKLHQTFFKNNDLKKTYDEVDNSIKLTLCVFT